jgi:hypothetical protein
MGTYLFSFPIHVPYCAILPAGGATEESCGDGIPGFRAGTAMSAAESIGFGIPVNAG